jgi:hypothetical protein
VKFQVKRFLLLRRRVKTKERSDFQGSDYWSEAVYMMVIRFENFATWISLMYEMTHFFVFFFYMNVVGFFNIGYWFIFTDVCMYVSSGFKV